jgi:hypothetical protein
MLSSLSLIASELSETTAALDALSVRWLCEAMNASGGKIDDGAAAALTGPRA